MKKSILTILISMLMAFGLLTACGEQTQEEPGKVEQTEDRNEESSGQDSEEVATFPVTITDALDQEVTVEEKPEKIVSLIPSNTEIAFALGLNEQIVGVSDYDNYPEEALTKEKVGAMEFNVEKIISLSPNLVLAHESGASTQTEALDQIRNAGIAVFVVNDATSFDEVYETIETIGQLTGTTAEAGQVVQTMKDDLQAVLDKVANVEEKKSVYVEVAPAPDIYSTGKNTFMDQMLSLIHAENVMGDQEGWIAVNQEAVIALNPDVIVTTYGYYTEDPKGQVLSREGWQDMTAIVNENVYDVHSDLVTRTGPRLAEGVEELAKAVYPELFAE